MPFVSPPQSSLSFPTVPSCGFVSALAQALGKPTKEAKPTGGVPRYWDRFSVEKSH